MYLWCWLQELPFPQFQEGKKKLVWIGLTKTKSTIKVNKEVEFVILSKKKIPSSQR